MECSIKNSAHRSVYVQVFSPSRVDYFLSVYGSGGGGRNIFITGRFTPAGHKFFSCLLFKSLFFLKVRSILLRIWSRDSEIYTPYAIHLTWSVNCKKESKIKVLDIYIKIKSWNIFKIFLRDLLKIYGFKVLE